MSTTVVKINEGLYLGKAELKRFGGLINTANEVVSNLQKQAGIIRNYDGSLAQTSFIVSQGSSATKITISSGGAVAFISGNIKPMFLAAKVDIADILPDSNDYYIKIQAVDSVLEEGTCSVSASGQLTGVGTKFTEVLRGQPDFPSRIEFVKSGLVNTGEFEVVSVTDDLTVQLSGSSFTAEIDLTYKVIGTFTPDIVVPTPSKVIFGYGDYDVLVEANDAVNNTDTFLLAKVNTDGITLLIEDMREQWAKSNAEDLITRLDTPTNPLIGVEWAKYDQVYGAGDRNAVKVAWGYTAEAGNWTFSVANKQITITAGSGGIFASNADVANGDFDGWKIYFPTQRQYAHVVSSTVGGGNVLLVLDRWETQNFPVATTDKIVVVPDCETIELRVKVGAALDYMVEDNYFFPVFEGYAIIPIKVMGGIIRFRHITNKQTTELKLINDGQYIDETSWDADGVLTVASYSNVVAGEITLLLSPTAWATIIGNYAHLVNDNYFQGRQAFVPRVGTIAAGALSITGSGNIVYASGNPVDTFPDLGLGTILFVYAYLNDITVEITGNIGVPSRTNDVVIRTGRWGVFYQLTTAPAAWRLMWYDGVNEIPEDLLIVGKRVSNSDVLRVGVLNQGNASKNAVLAYDATTLNTGAIWQLPNKGGMMARYTDYTEDWTTVTTTAGDMTASGGGTWTGHANVSLKYKILGKTIFIKFIMTPATTIAGVPAIVYLEINGLPSNFKNDISALNMVSGENTAGQVAMRCQAILGTKQLWFQKSDISAFANGNLYLQGTITTELE